MRIAHNSSTPDSAMPPGFLADLIDVESLCRDLRITRPTLAKLEADRDLAFPLSLKLGQKTYFNRTAVRSWIAMRTGVDSES